MTQSPVVTVTPQQFHRDQSIDLMVTPAAGMDFSGVQSNGVAFVPATGLDNLQAIPQLGGHLTVSVGVDAGAPTGIRTLVIIGPDHLVMASGIIRITP
jgi:hypothetical protein